MYAAHIADAQEDVDEAERLGVDLHATEHHHPGDGQQERPGVAPAPGEHRGDRDGSDELDHDALAQIDAVDREVEEQVHQRRGDAEHGSCLHVAAGPATLARAR